MFKTGVIDVDGTVRNVQPGDMNMNVRTDAFNVLNTPIFIQEDRNMDPPSTNFGKIFPDTGQWNRPRILQLGFKFE
jgi:hypothetical protein